jgi:hypothetical protein
MTARSTDFHPTSGCITVDEPNKDKAFEIILEALNAHPSIHCDWIDGHEIKKALTVK